MDIGGFAETIKLKSERGNADTVSTDIERSGKFKSFVYGSIRVMLVGGVKALIFDIKPRRNSRPAASEALFITGNYNDYSNIFRSGLSRSRF